MIKLYASPMEGVTGYVWRQAHRSVFGGADQYLAPFVSPNKNFCFQTGELRELSQGERNLIPQILTNRAEYFVWAARELFSMGYDEVNLNLGCPSGTVTAKHKGSGMLRSPEDLDCFLDGIFSDLPEHKISIKTRIGIRHIDEWPALLAVFERYPLHALMVHPRLQTQMYRGEAMREIFLETLRTTRLPLIYNGDVLRPNDAAFSYGCDVMVGRGLICDPALLRRQRGGDAATREELIRFHDLLLDGYAAYMPGESPLLHRMWEFWHYFATAFEGSDTLVRRLTKAKTLAEYRSAADRILQGCSIAI